MRLVFAHVDRVAVERAERAVEESVAADASGSASMRATDALVAFVCVESGDGVDESGVVAGAQAAIRAVAERLRVAAVVLYPEALSSPRPAAASAAAPVFEYVVDALTDASFDVLPAAFGWRHRFDVDVKGHPFATAARTIRPGDHAVDDSESAESDESDEVAESSESAASWSVVDPAGDRLDVEEFLAERAPLAGVERAMRAVVDSLDGPRHAVDASSGETPPDRGDRAVALGVADRDPLATDARWRPTGVFLRERIGDAVADAVPADAMPIAGPAAFDLADDAVRAYAADRGARGYGIVVDEVRVLPDAFGCANALATMADADVDVADEPVSFFSRDAPAPATESAAPGRPPSTGGSDGVAVSGNGIAPTVHTAVADETAAREVVFERARSALSLGNACGLDPVVACRTTDSFGDARDWFDALADALDAPVLVADTDAVEPWSLRVDVVTATGTGAALATGTVGVDPESARRFRSRPQSRSGETVPTVVHAAPAGALAATVAAVVDAPAGRDDPDPLPAWLAPTQVRLVPVAADHVERCSTIADELAGVDELAGRAVRVDVDDRERAVGDRIERAARDRVPHYVVVGDDEVGNESLPVTDVATGRERSQTVAELAATIADATAGSPHRDRRLPRRDRPLPRRLSRRPRFDDG
jgi:threonyl-tRNA synthetase